VVRGSHWSPRGLRRRLDPERSSRQFYTRLARMTAATKDTVTSGKDRLQKKEGGVCSEGGKDIGVSKIRDK